MQPAATFVSMVGYIENGNTNTWIVSAVVNGVTYLSRQFPSAGDGFNTFILHADDCTATDHQHYVPRKNANDSPRFVNYLQALNDGIHLLFVFNTFYRATLC